MVENWDDAVDEGYADQLKERMRSLLAQEVTSLSGWKRWLAAERGLCAEAEEIITGHRIRHYQDTSDKGRRDAFLYVQAHIEPLLAEYNAEFDRKFNECPFTEQLEEEGYGYMRKVRLGRSKALHQENIGLQAREQELITEYRGIMAGITIEWDGEQASPSSVKAMLDSPDRSLRERAWRALHEAHKEVKPTVDRIMDELVGLRHRMAQNAGFDNYRDYLFTLKNRDYSVEDCFRLAESVERHAVPAWKKAAKLFQAELGIDAQRPWDLAPCTLRQAPFQTSAELLDGVEAMLGRTDCQFQEVFRHIRKAGLIDVEGRMNKAPGAVCFTLPRVEEAFIYSNFSASFNAVTALIHETGHAIHFYKQFENPSSMQEGYLREEVAELYSHALELLTMDKLDVFYPDGGECRKAQREQLRRSLSMLISPLSGDLFQHWLYTNPDHSPEERDAKYLELSKRFRYSSVDLTGCEAEVGASWIESFHYFQYPFYKIEYAISQLGALRLFQLYRENPGQAIAFFKAGASADWNAPIADIYRKTGVEFDFSEQAVEQIAAFLVE